VATLRNQMSAAHGKGPKPLYDKRKENADNMIQLTSANVTLVV